MATCNFQPVGIQLTIQLWLAYAYFEVRRVDINAARKVLGAGIGMCPKPKLFTGYIELEMRLREFDRVRALYERFLTVSISTAVFNNQLTDSTTRLSRPHGSSGPRLKVHSKTLSVSAASLSLPCNSRSTCPRSSGRRTLTLSVVKASENELANCTSVSWSGHRTSRCTSRTPLWRCLRWVVARTRMATRLRARPGTTTWRGKCLSGATRHCGREGRRRM